MICGIGIQPFDPVVRTSCIGNILISLFQHSAHYLVAIVRQGSVGDDAQTMSLKKNVEPFFRVEGTMTGSPKIDVRGCLSTVPEGIGYYRQPHDEATAGLEHMHGV